VIHGSREVLRDGAPSAVSGWAASSRCSTPSTRRAGLYSSRRTPSQQLIIEINSWLNMKELGGDSYFKRMYDMAGTLPKVAATLGNVEPGDGVKLLGTTINDMSKAGVGSYPAVLIGATVRRYTYRACDIDGS
jgi:hypothetical protein